MRWSSYLAVALGCLAMVAFLQPQTSQAADGPAYKGSESCKKCHFKQHKSWQATNMAKSFENLKPGVAAEAKTKAGMDPQKDYTTDSSCLPCHTTGYGKPGGFTSIEATPDLAGVGCEACHGPGGDYLEIMTLKNKDHTIQSMAEKGLIYPAKEEQCLQCHGEGNPFTASVDPKYTWDFDKYVRNDAQMHEHAPLKGAHPDLAGLNPLFQ